MSIRNQIWWLTDSGAHDKSYQTARRGEAPRRHTRLERIRLTSQDVPAESSHFKNSTRGGESLAEGTKPYTVRATAVTDDVLTGAWSVELDKELCEMTETLWTNAMVSIIDPDNLRWINIQDKYNTAGSAWDQLTERRGLMFAEIGVLPDARIRSSMKDLAGKDSTSQLDGIGSSLTESSDRLKAKTLERDRSQHLCLSLRYGAYCETVRTVGDRQTQKQKQEERGKKLRLQQDFKGVLTKRTWRKDLMGMSWSMSSLKLRKWSSVLLQISVWRPWSRILGVKDFQNEILQRRTLGQNSVD